jgi:tetratricopeptide (TPR) repeat protein
MMRTILIGLALLPFVLLLGTVFADNHFLVNGVVSAKYFWFYASMGLMIPVAFMLQPIKHWHVSDGFVLLLGVSILVVAFLSGAPLARTKLILLILLVLLYFLTRRLLTTLPAAESLISFCLITTALAECVLGLRQLYGFTPSNHVLFKLTGTFFNPGPYSGYIGMIFPLALYQALQFFTRMPTIRTISRSLLKPRVWFPYLFWGVSMVTVVASLLVIPAAMSRAAWTGVTVGSCVVLLVHAPFRNFIKGYINTVRKKIIVVSLILVIIGGAGVGIYALKPGSAHGRLLLWKHALKTMVDHPFGVGLGKMGQAVGVTQAAYFAENRATQAEIDRTDVPSYAFNEYLQIGVESGILAVVLYLSLLAITLRNAFKTRRYGVAGAILSLSFFAFFSYPFSVLPFLIVLVFLLAISNTNQDTHPAIDNLDETTHSPPFSYKWSYTLTTSLLCTGLIAWCLIDRYPTYKAWRDWNQSKQLLNVTLYSDAAEEMQLIYPYLNDQPEFLFDYARALSFSGRYQLSNQVLERSMSFSGDPMLYNIHGKNCMALHQYDQAEVAFKQAYNRVPNRLYPLYLLSKMYAGEGETNKAIETATILFNHTIIVPSKAIEEMKDTLRLLLNRNSFEQP